MSARIQAARLARNWSQQQLADRAGVTRQLVSSLESGRHTPSVAAALAIAGALGRSVEDLFGPEPQTVVVCDLSPQPDQHDPGGAARSTTATGLGAVAVGQVGGRRVTYPVRQSIREEWSLADGLMQEGQLELIASALVDLVIAGCDPLLPAIARLLDATSGYRLMPQHASTASAITALAAGHIHGALVHGPTSALPSAPPGVRRWHLARWQVGLAATEAHGAAGPEGVAERHTPVIQREPGASSQQAFERAMRAVGSHAVIPGPIGTGHLDVAHRILHGMAPVGVTMEPAALNLGLTFTPVEEHRVELWIDQAWCELPAAVALLELAGGDGLRRRSAILAGYDLTGAGSSCSDQPAGFDATPHDAP